MSSPVELTEARWARMEKLFDAAIELPREARAAYLDEHCDDAELRREVEALIAANETGGRRVEQLIREAAGKALAADVTGSKSLGPYRIVSTIGHGGMGVVYLAERSDDEFSQRVAIKLLHKTMVSPELLQRFRSERQILADLNHPNIAHLIDGGTTGDGVPYLVMEYVDGKPIVQYCDDHQLTVRDRIDMFRQVCAAIEMAHQNLIVHRDIKPNNILVTRDGTPKLLDFGIAKNLAGPSGPGASDLTLLGDRLLTPNYASPEQVAGRPVTTASDIYSLGVLLYELLCGVCPFDLSRLSPAEMERIVTTVEPEAPSRLLAAGPGASPVPGRSVSREPQAVAMDRGTTVDRLLRQLRGDLDNIALHALRKDRARRYRSVGRFSEDLRSHLRGQTVTARPDTFGYRAGKFVQRNRIAVSVGALFVTFLVGAAVVTTIQANRLAKEARKAQATVGFLTSLISASDPLRARDSAPPTLRGLLDEGAQRVVVELDDQPLVRSQLQETIGNTYYSLDETQKALASLSDALATRERELGPRHPDLVQPLILLGTIQLDLGNWEASRSLLERALTISREEVGDPSEALARSQHAMAEFLRERDLRDEAEALYRDSLATFEQLGPDHDETRAVVMRGIGLLVQRRGDFEEAETWFRRALEIDRRLMGDEHPFVAHDLENIAIVLHARGDLEAAGPFYRESKRILDIAFEDDPTHEKLLRATSTLARFYFALGRHEEAERYYAEAIARFTDKHGPQHRLVAFNKRGMARALRGQGRVEEAEALLREAIATYETTVGTEHPLYSEALRNLGDLLRELGRVDEAIPLLERALAISRTVEEAGHWHIALCMSDLAAALTLAGRHEAARTLLGQAERDLIATLGEGHKHVAAARERAARIPPP